MVSVASCTCRSNELRTSSPPLPACTTVADALRSAATGACSSCRQCHSAKVRLLGWFLHHARCLIGLLVTSRESMYRLKSGLFCVIESILVPSEKQSRLQPGPRSPMVPVLKPQPLDLTSELTAAAAACGRSRRRLPQLHKHSRLMSQLERGSFRGNPCHLRKLSPIFSLLRRHSCTSAACLSKLVNNTVRLANQRVATTLRL